MAEPQNSEETIFHHASELPAAGRGTYLDQACAGDAALRTRVEALLQAHDEVGTLLDAAPGGAVRVALTAPPPDEMPGTLIGRYKLLQKIGEGGCGVVYMAEQEEPVRRRVALKVIKLGMDTQEVVTRFEAERQALALMDHPNIARVLDGGATATGRPYFVMELVRGVPLTTYCDEHSLSTPARLELFMQVCQAVQHAHQKGIIHRDLKPSNILVTVNDGTPVPKVIDFGIAKATQGRLTDRTLFTAFEQFIGTPAYMSPEQAELTSLDVDTRSDIYSLGVLLYELLTGRTPFDAKSLLQSGLDEIRRVIREVEPPRPSVRLSTLTDADRATVAKLRATAPPQLSMLLRGDLDWIVMRCLEKDRRRRYETANGIAADIRRHLASEPIIARPPSAGYLLRKFIARHKLVVLAASLLAVSLVGGLAVSTALFLRERQALERARTAEQQTAQALNQAVLLRNQAEQARNEAQTSAQAAMTEARKSAQVAQFLKDMLKGIGPSVALGRDSTLLREILKQTERRVREDLKDQPEVASDLLDTMGQVYGELGDFKRALPILREGLELRRQLHGRDSSTVAESCNNLGSVLAMAGDGQAAEPLLREALDTRLKIYGEDTVETVESLNNLSGLLFLTDRSAEAEPLIQRAAAICRQLAARGKPTPNFTSVLSTLAGLSIMSGKLAQAESLTHELLALERAGGTPVHPELVTSSLSTLSYLLVMRGKYAEAEAAQREGLLLARQYLGNSHPVVAQVLSNLASGLTKSGRLAEAESSLREAMAISQQITGPGSGDTLWQTCNLGRVMLARGDYAAAEQLFRTTLPLIRKQEILLDSALLAAALNGLGEALLRRGLMGEADPLLTEALAIHEKTPLANTPDYLASFMQTLNLLAAAKLDQADPAAAEALLHRARDLHRSVPDLYLAEKLSTLLYLGRAVRLGGRFVEAEVLLGEGWEKSRPDWIYVSDRQREALAAELATLYARWQLSDPTKSGSAQEWKERLDNFNR